MDNNFLDIPTPQYLGRRRKSTELEIAAFAEAISFKKDEPEDDKEIRAVG